MKFGKDAKFAAHVMGGFYFATEGRTAKNHFARAEMHGIGEVRMAAGVLTDGERGGFVGKMAAKKWIELGEVEFLSFTNGRSLVLKSGHFLSRHYR